MTQWLTMEYSQLVDLISIPTDLNELLLHD